MRRTDWKRVSLSGVMQLFGVICIKWIERLMAGISHQHVLSYNPKRRSLESVFVNTTFRAPLYMEDNNPQSAKCFFAASMA